MLDMEQRLVLLPVIEHLTSVKLVAISMVHFFSLSFRRIFVAS
jgi:hypothetical protein